MNKRMQQLRFMCIKDLREDKKVSEHTLRLIIESPYKFHTITEGLK